VQARGCGRCPAAGETVGAVVSWRILGARGGNFGRQPVRAGAQTGTRLPTGGRERDGGRKSVEVSFALSTLAGLITEGETGQFVEGFLL